MEQAGRMFGELERPINEIAERDVAEAGRCFALGVSTASAFHILRACELLLIEYCKVCKLDISEKNNWGGYLAALGTVRDLPVGVRGRLTRLKDYDRNEIMHPARFLSEHEAAVVFDFTKASMIEMMEDILARRPKPQGKRTRGAKRRG